MYTCEYIQRNNIYHKVYEHIVKYGQLDTINIVSSYFNFK